MSNGMLVSRWVAAASAAALIFGAFAWLSPVKAGEVTLSSADTGGANAVLHVRSFQELKFEDTIHQAHDYSCGSAALATLLTYNYQLPVTEQTVFQDMIQNGDMDRIKKDGFSLLDLKEYLARHNLQAGGFRAPLEKLAQVGVPAIVLIDHDGYRHFVVVRGIDDGRVLLSDPSLGTRAVAVQQFTKEWNGIFFLILTNADAAQQTFNNSKVWAAAPRSPWDLARFQIDLLHPEAAGIRNSNVF